MWSGPSGIIKEACTRLVQLGKSPEFSQMDDEAARIYLQFILPRMLNAPQRTTKWQFQRHGIAVLDAIKDGLLYKGARNGEPLVLKKLVQLDTYGYLNESELNGYNLVHQLATRGVGADITEAQLTHLIIRIMFARKLVPFWMFIDPSSPPVSKVNSPFKIATSTPPRANLDSMGAPKQGNALVHSPYLPALSSGSPAQSASVAAAPTSESVPAVAAPTVNPLRSWCAMYRYPCTLADMDPLREGNLARLIRHMTIGLDWLHTAKLAHMDVKPDNIFISCKKVSRPDVVVFLLGDFGSVRTFGCPTFSTPAFVPHELQLAADKRPVSSALHDWWMLAVTVTDVVLAPEARTIGNQVPSQLETVAALCSLIDPVEVEQVNRLLGRIVRCSAATPAGIDALLKAMDPTSTGRLLLSKHQQLDLVQKRQVQCATVLPRLIQVTEDQLRRDGVTVPEHESSSSNSSASDQHLSRLHQLLLALPSASGASSHSSP